MDSEDWKTREVAAGARHHATGHFLHCLKLLDAGDLAEAERKLTRGVWRTDLDLSGIPPEVIHTTDTFCWRAFGLIRYGDSEALRATVEKILKVWT